MRAVALFVVPLFVVAVSACAAGKTATTGAEKPRLRPLAVYAAGKQIAVVRPGEERFRLPARFSDRRGITTREVAVPSHLARKKVRRALAAHAARVDLPVVPLRTTIALRPVRQVLHNDCESTALSMLLAAAGVPVGQLRLQAGLPRSGPLDPEPVEGSSLLRWGDPERGFVGRPAGGGTGGGFGVYEPPVRALAARYGARLVDLHGRSVAAVRSAVLAGHPVLAWVGLAAGPYLSWLTPSGRKITVDLSEHAVTLVGAGPGYLLVNNPLTGRRERWSEALFSSRWRLLGRRALELRQH